MKISLLIPCYNEEQSIETSIVSWLSQTRKFDEIVVVDDSSTDRTPEVLARYAHLISVRRTPQNLGNKSHAQEYGLQFITGDIMVTTDADTILDEHFVEYIEKDFSDPDVVAVAGYVRSLPYNWLTLCRAFDYAIGQNIHKLAQSHLNYVFVMPGAASAFRREAFNEHIDFDHDTITEDLDFTYKLHHKRLRIVYNRQAVAYTQDPAELHSYVNQMRRWYSGGWQNLLKHYRIVLHFRKALELSLVYIEGVVFSLLLFIIPLLNPSFGIRMLVGSFVLVFLYSVWVAYKEKRPGLLLVAPPYMFILYVNAYVFLEQFVKVVLLKQRHLQWFKPKRVNINR